MATGYDIAPQLPAFDLGEMWENARIALRECAARMAGALLVEQETPGAMLAEEDKESREEEKPPDPHSKPESEWDGVKAHDSNTCTAIACSACGRRG